ncbi:MAG: SPFH domain-containing protein [Corynebacteriales bacterium]|nr:SPFH domain-containing protein [Mycobacteriales bacterium]
MADILRLFFMKQLRGTPTMHIIHTKKGQVKRSGTGLSFMFRSQSAVLAEVPVDDRELPLLFHARTSDFQDVTVQAAVTYRIVEPETAARRLDFGIDPVTGRWRATPLEQLATSLTELAQQPALDLLVGLTLTEALAAVIPVREHLDEALRGDERLAEMGLQVVAVRVVAIRPEPELERALQTPTREAVQIDADRATYERRALAVERERAIAENELANQIALATREQELVTQRGLNARRQAEDQAAAARIEAAGKAEREQILAEARAHGVRAIGAAEAESERSRLQAAAGVSDRVLYALALREAAGKLPSIGQLTITPDVVTDLVTSLAQARPAAGNRVKKS